MQHGRCSNVCNNLWLADRELAQRRTNDQHQRHLGQLQATVTNLDAVTRNLNRRINFFWEHIEASGSVIIARIEDESTHGNRIMIDLNQRLAALEAQMNIARETRSRSPRRNT